MKYKLFLLPIFLWLFGCMSIVGITAISSKYGATSLEYSWAKWSQLPAGNRNELANLQFESPDNYLGILYLPFTKGQVLPDVQVEVSVIDYESKKLVHSHEYMARSFVDMPKFPIGLPVVEKSKNKQYQVIIKSKSNKIREIKVDNTSNLTTIHIIDRNKLNKANISEFIKAKVLTAFQAIGVWPYIAILLACMVFAIFIYFLIKLGRLTGKVLHSSHLRLYMKWFMVGLIVVIPRRIPDIVILLWLICHIYVSYLLKDKPKDHYFFSLIIFVFILLPVVFFDINRVENTANLFFLSILIGFIQEIWILIKAKNFINRYVQKIKL